ncbi:B-cell receptor-associated protein 31 [Homalodisca vitripennis]|uniref:B-cell receptor-associated protein 31 n=1 Tax=Homalodisca vitripennis TaxID=197043 RepID=UPI001EEC57C5|nr:B-cell receptor-associated protein 31 [Homalodisca vitripennis]XP_046667394.1 B-cell receptor-associated protein 31 [Homalodisca vitripennis]XP_046667395.1 B-cell receptor-associated protein 31 [Homalodisca vitripennis]KAG8296621.1 b-cell receptor-associated protein [Homalodisca vitripennis]KAG8334429.1 b-cell receptor-associated protein [Homalodisca vitripennis]
MSLQWTLIAGFLYAEIFVVLLLVLPVASPVRWQRLFKSRFLQAVTNQASWYFAFILFVLVLFLCDAIREMRKYSSAEEAEKHAHLDAEMQVNMRLFRAQRNFYISGFALFLSLVIRRLVSLISQQAVLLAQSEAAMKQAQSATTTARSLLSQKGSGEVAQNSSNEAHDKEVTDLKEKIKALERDLSHEKKDKEAMISQSESIKKEYDRLLNEHRKIQEKVAASNSDKED